MLCINKRLYWCYRACGCYRSDGPDRSHRPNGRNGCHRTDRSRGADRT